MTKKPALDRNVMRLFDGYVHGQITRREFLDRAAAFTASGVTAAALLGSLTPDYALAQQVDPDDKSILASYKKYASPKGAGVMRGYFVRPAVIQHKLPAVVVIHENRGLNPYIEDVARRLAVSGLLAFAPDALTPLGGYPGDDDAGRALQRQRDSEEMVEDFSAAVAFLTKHPDCTGKVGAVGFCFGGYVSNMLAATIPDVIDAAVPFYGTPAKADIIPNIKAPLMIQLGELDKRVNATWPDYEKALKAIKANYQTFIYEGVNHGFHNDSTGRYDEKAAELAWSRTIEFFEEHLDT